MARPWAHTLDELELVRVRQATEDARLGSRRVPNLSRTQEFLTCSNCSQANQMARAYNKRRANDELLIQCSQVRVLPGHWGGGWVPMSVTVLRQLALLL